MKDIGINIRRDFSVYAVLITPLIMLPIICMLIGNDQSLHQMLRSLILSSTMSTIFMMLYLLMGKSRIDRIQLLKNGFKGLFVFIIVTAGSILYYLGTGGAEALGFDLTHYIILG